MSSAVHDLGYKRYVGTRRSTGTRWRVIARQQMSAAWKSWWRWKLVSVLALIVVGAAAMMIFVFADSIVGRLSKQVPFTIASFALPLTFGLFRTCAFIASLVVGASIVASDLQSGAFVFYFARSTRPRDYLLGKLAGYGAVVGSAMVVGPLLVAIMRVALTTTHDTHELVSALGVIPEAVGLGLFATLAYTAIPLAFSAMFRKRSYALGMWFAYYMIVGGIATGVGFAGNMGWISALDIANAIESLSNRAFHLPQIAGGVQIPVAAALASIALQSAAALALVYWKLSTAQKAGVGGAT